ncbi:hypothetical protein APHAL10511_005436 [Amanita phalloides]|nr:hypothetical protein APHAL10511_005436 [Amanita phalloides]
MMNDDVRDEQNVRDHIRNLLFHYVKANVTVDYVGWTEKAVAELLQDCLREIPIVDPTSLWIPTEPFDVLKRLYKLSDLSAYDEKLQASPHALDSLRNALRGGQGKITLDMAAYVDNSNPPEWEMMDAPILTIRAIRNTPKLPSGSLSVIHQKGPFHISEGIKCVENDDSEEAPSQNDMLYVLESSQETEVSIIPMSRNVNWQTSASESQAVPALLRAKLYFSGRVPSYSIDSSDERDIWSSRIYRPDSPFIPLFPRNARNKNTNSEVGNRLNSFVELSAHLSPQISTEGLEKDLFNDNMRVIDDWGAFQTSSPLTVSTPSSSQEDRKINSLFRGTSPVTDPIEELEATKMDIVHIPRSRRPGGRTKGKIVAEGDSFSSFILGTLRESKEPAGGGSGGQDCLEESVSSLAGEASCSATKAVFATVEEADMNDDIRAFYANESSKDFWLQETLDEKSMMLIEGKQCLRDHHMFLPSRFNDFCLASKDQDGGATFHKFLKRVKGLQPLNVALSWKAFSTNSPLPSNAQLAKVSSCFEECDYGESGVSVQAVRQLIDASKPDGADRAVVLGKLCLLGDEHEKSSSLLSAYGPDIILTKRERWRRARVAWNEMLQVEDTEGGPVGNQIEAKEVIRSNRGQTSRGVITNMSEKPEPTVTTSKEANIESVQQFHPNVEDSFRKFLFEKFGKDNSPEPYNLTPCSNQPLCSTALWHEANIAAFAELRTRTVSLPAKAVSKPPIVQSEPNISCVRDRTIPSDIFTRTTLQLPPEMKLPNAVHYYMASLDLLQKQMLVRAFRQPECSVTLIERDCLGGADVIIDPFTAVLYRSLFSLPSESEELITHIAKLSWAFRRLLIVLEAYPPAYAIRALDQAIEHSSLYAYTPPILKAIKKLRRGVAMVEADREKRPSTLVLYSFPNTVQEAAALTRYIGDMAQEADETDGVLWSDRSWLESIDKDEENLSNGSGMNRFISAIVLNQVPLDDFVTMTGEERHQAFSKYVGADAIALFNADFQERVLMQSSDNPSYGSAALEWFTNEHDSC